MEKFVRKVVQTGYGLGLLSAAQAKHLAVQAKKDLHLNEEESKRLAHALLKNSRETGMKVGNIVKAQVEKALLKAKVVDRKEWRLVKKIVKRRLHRLTR